MKTSQLVIAALLVGIAVLSVEAFGQRDSGTPPPVPGRYQISASHEGPAPLSSAYILDTQTGRIWKIRDAGPIFKVGDLPDKE